MEQSTIGETFLCFPVSTNGCETLSLDAFPYTWEEPKNCIFTVLNRFPAKMIQNKESY